MCQIVNLVCKSLTLLLVFITLGSCANTGQEEEGQITVTVLHTNDVHSRFRQTNKYGGSCSEEEEKENKCYAGFARLHHKVGYDILM